MHKLSIVFPIRTFQYNGLWFTQGKDYLLKILSKTQLDSFALSYSITSLSNSISLLVS